MMRMTFWRLMLSMLLVVVLPVQGYAATRMLACDTQASSQMGAAKEVSALLHAGHDSAAANPHEHHHGDIAAQSHGQSHDMAVMTDLPSTAHAGDMSDHAPAHGKCTSCAPCCIGAALTTSTVVLSLPHTSHLGFATSSSAHASAYVGLPDRPPQALHI
jgi:hypothetical protein